MKKIVIISLFMCSASLSAHWIPFGNNKHKDVFFYHNHEIRRQGDIVYVLYRVRYAKLSDLGDGSREVHLEINCADASLKIVRSTYYTDRNWTDQSSTRGKIEKQQIVPMSIFDRLSDFLCTSYH